MPPLFLFPLLGYPHLYPLTLTLFVSLIIKHDVRLLPALHPRGDALVLALGRFRRRRGHHARAERTPERRRVLALRHETAARRRRRRNDRSMLIKLMGPAAVVAIPHRCRDRRRVRCLPKLGVLGGLGGVLLLRVEVAPR